MASPESMLSRANHHEGAPWCPKGDLSWAVDLGPSTLCAMLCSLGEESMRVGAGETAWGKGIPLGCLNI